MTTLATETWTGSNGAAWPAQWTTAVSGTGIVDIQGNRGRLATSTGGYVLGNYARLTSPTAQADTDLLVDVTLTTTTEQYLFLSLRANAASATTVATTGYHCRIYQGGAALLRAGSTMTQLGSTYSSAWTPNVARRVRFQCVGTTVRVKVWDPAATEPATWNISATDATFASGGVNVGLSNGSAGTQQIVYLDNLTLTDAASGGGVTVTGATAQASATADGGSVSVGAVVAVTVSGATATATAAADTGWVTVPSFTMTVTPEPNAIPPRLRIDVVDTRSTTASQVTITRRNPDGHSYPVRTSDDGPLPVNSGIATIYDYEAPYDSPLVYTTDISGGPTVVAELDVADPWLIHPGVPSRSQPLDFSRGSFDAIDRPINFGSFTVLGRGDPVINSSGARSTGASSFILMTQTLPQAAALDLLFDDGSPLYLNIPPALNYGIDSAYIFAGDVKVGRPSPVAMHPDRTYTVTYQVVGRPTGGTQAAITWNDVAAKYSSWQAIIDAGVQSWADLAAPTG